VSPFPVLKLVHVVAAIVAVGSNVTYWFWHRRAGHDRDRILYTLVGIRAIDRMVAIPAQLVLSSPSC
jgi:hypothetical protein